MNEKNKAGFSIVWILAVSVTLTACQLNQPRGGSAADDINTSLAESVQQSRKVQAQPVTPPPEVAAALLPPLNVELSGVGQAPIERRFDITVNRAPARTFFMSLVKDTPYNMVAHPAIKGKISLSLKNVTIDEVMNTVRNVYGYEFKRTKNGYEVLPAKLRSRIFKVDYLNVKRSGLSQVRVSSGQVSAASSNDSGSSDSSSGSSSDAGTISGSQVNTLSESDFWSELSTALGAIIGSKDGRQVVTSPQSGIVVVRAMPNELRAVA